MDKISWRSKLRSIQGADNFHSEIILKKVEKSLKFIAVKHGSFSGGFVGALIGAFGTILAGMWAWDGVQDQLSEQRRSNNISEKTLLRSEIDRSEKGKSALASAIKYWGSLNVLGSSAQILAQGGSENPYNSMFNEYRAQFEMVSNESRKNFEKIVEDLPTSIKARTSISILKTSAAYLIKDSDSQYLFMKEAYLKEEAEESGNMIKIINTELRKIENSVITIERRAESLKVD